MRPEEIGDLLGTDPESVIVAREGALEQLASELGMEDVSELDDMRARLAELPAAAWTGQAAPETGQQPETAAIKAAEAEPPVREAPSPRSPPARRSRLPLLLALLAVAAIVLVVVLASSGGADKQTASTPQQKPSKPKPSKPKPSKPTPAAPKAGPTVRLTPLGGARGASGTAELTQGGKRLSIKASGLSSGAYQVWLYDSVIETKSLTKVSGTKLDLDLKLPPGASRYRYVDISLEPPDGNPNHSGESVLRAPLSKLSR
jgi:hypothetical protein